MVEDFQNIFVFAITLSEVIANTLVALFCGIIIAFVYKKTYRGINYSASFTVSIVMLTMITAIVIMVIGNNLARAFGMVGAMSIIRFRTAVKDTSDIMFIFFALAIGLAAGVKFYSIAIFGTILISVVYLVISALNFDITVKKEFLLQILASSSELKDNPFEDSMKKFCSKSKLVNVKSNGEEAEEVMEFSYYISLKNEKFSKDFVAALKKTKGVQQVNLYFDEV